MICSVDIIVCKTAKGITPASAFDAEELDRFPLNTEFDIVPRTHRSSKQNRTYWLALNKIVAATDRWPDSRHLHDALRRSLGYIHVRKDLSGEPYLALDSTAFDSMSANEFSAYFERAIARLAQVTQCDPLAFLDEHRAV